MCTFPAKELHAEMRRIAQLADESHDAAQIAFACCFVKATNDLRLSHEDITGCNCWYEAVEAAKEKIDWTETFG